MTVRDEPHLHLQGVPVPTNPGRSLSEANQPKIAAAKDGFQVGQTAKARQGPPCAVTPKEDMAARF